jgi:hypothetical protein
MPFLWHLRGTVVALIGTVVALFWHSWAASGTSLIESTDRHQRLISLFYNDLGNLASRPNPGSRGQTPS